MWWRTAATDVVEDGSDGWGGGRRLVWDGVLARTVYEWEKGGRGMGNHVFGTRLSEIWESYELSPRLKFGRLVGWGYDGNLASRQYLPRAISGEERVVGAHGWCPRCMNWADR